MNLINHRQASKIFPLASTSGNGLRRHRLLLLTWSLLLLVAGCGKGKGDLQGTVTFEGKKLAMGQVWVIGSDSLAYYGAIQDDGSYVVKDIPTGECKIAVNSGNPADTGGGGRAGGSRLSNEKLPGDPKRWFAIPEAYNMHATSKLTFNIERGNNAFDIKLTAR